MAWRKGESHPKAKLTEAQVIEMRERRANGEPLREIAAAFGVAANTVWNATRGATWGNLGGALPAKPQSRARQEIARRWADGETTAEIAAALDMSISQVCFHVRASGGRDSVRITRKMRTAYQRWADGESRAEIAAALGIGRETVSRYIIACGGVSGKSGAWAHADEIISRWRGGETQAAIAAALGADANTVGKIILAQNQNGAN